jgi:acyl phosphate:glycerol-3-phosphate acyltransferase
MPGISLLIAYILGSIPTAVWVSKWGYDKDIRDYGSRNAGLTNVFRVLGWKPALPVIVVDLFKGMGAVYLTMHLLKGQQSFWPLLAGVVAILGHSYTFMAGFRGGKGVLTAFGVFLALAPISALLAFVSWVFVVYFSRIVSLASIVAAIVLAASIIFEFIYHRVQSDVAITGVLVACFVVYKHKSNISRLIQGTENKFGSPKK